MHFSKDPKQRNAIFSTFLQVAQHSCRMMKKFYLEKASGYIKEGLNTIRRGFEL